MRSKLPPARIKRSKYEPSSMQRSEPSFSRHTSSPDAVANTPCVTRSAVTSSRSIGAAPSTKPAATGSSRRLCVRSASTTSRGATSTSASPAAASGTAKSILL